MRTPSAHFRRSGRGLAALLVALVLSAGAQAQNDDLSAEDDAVTATEDVPLSISAAFLLSNDEAPDEVTLTIVAVSEPSNGTVSRNGDDIVYAPAPDFNGGDAFTYTVSDGDGGTDEATVEVTVSPVNDAPRFTSDPVTGATESVAYSYTVTASDPEGDATSFSFGVPLPEWLSVDGGPPDDGAITLEGTPTADDVGTYDLEIRVTDGEASNTQAFTLTVEAAGPALSAVDDETQTDAGVPVVISVLANDSGEGLTVVEVSDPPGGAAEISGNGQTVTYTSDAATTGTDTFTYTVQDEEGATATATVTVTVNAANGAPTAEPDAYSVDAGGVLSTPPPGVLGNDTDPDGDALTAVLVDDVSDGALTLAADGSFTYTPDDGFNGEDAFTYRASDGELSSEPTTVTITVSSANAAPTAQADAYSTSAGEALTVEAPGVLGNDSDPDGDALSTVLVSDVGDGTLELAADGSFTYTPDDGFTGTDSFTYRAFDGALASGPVTVSIAVSATNSAPVAEADAYTVAEDGTLSAPPPGVLGNDADPDGDAITAVLVTDATDGTLALAADGSFTYTPAADFNGEDTFTYRATDGELTSDPVTVTITVTPVNDEPTAQGEGYATGEDQTLTVDLPGVLANDSDPDGDLLTAVLVTDVENGSLDLAADGSFTYAPDPDFNGEDAFSYRATDGELSSEAVTVTIAIGGENDPPVAVADDASTAEDTAVRVDVLANDSDPDDDALTVTAVTDPPSGAAEVVEGGAAVRYTPDPGFSGTDTFSYTVSDGTLTATATVTVSVSSVNDAPAFTSAPVTDATENVAYSYTVTASDPDGDAVTFSASVLPPWLTLTSQGNGTAVLSGTPGDDDLGPFEVSLQVTDGTATATQSFTVFVAPVPDPPVAVDDAASTPEDTPIDVPVLANDTDADGDPLTVTAVSEPSAGTAAIVGGAVRYTPDPDVTGTDTFTYTASDGTSTATAEVTVTVTPVDDAPVARPDVYVTGTDATLSTPPPGVLANDSDPDSDLAAELASDVVNGSLTLDSDGSFEYRPNAGFVGSDVFSYRAIGDGVRSEPETVTIRVGGDNAAPAALPDEVSTAEDMPVAVAVLANDTDPDGDPLVVASVEQPSNGVATISADGTTVTYAPNPDFNGTDAFSYAASDGGDETSTASVAVTVTPVNDDPAAADDAADTRAGEAVSVAVLANDRDVDGDPLALTAVSTPANGRAVVQGTVVQYTPDDRFVGTDAFTYTVSDGSGGSGSALVTVTVRAGGAVSATAVAGPAVVGEPVTVTAAAAGFEPTAAELFYRPAGSEAYQVVALAPSGAGFAGTIPASAVTIRGVDYYVALSGGGARATSPAQTPAQTPRHLRVRIPQRTAPVTFGADGYRMVALPVAVATPTPEAVFADDLGPYDPAVWRLFRWTPAEAAYAEFPAVSTPLVPGRAVWLGARAGASFDVDDALSADASAPVTFTLPPGWSQIGTPFGFAVAWDDVAGSGAVSPPARWDGAEYALDQDVLEPWVGYFVENATGAPVTLTAPPEAAGAARRAGGAAGYRLRLRVEAGEYRDTQNVLGFAADAAPGRDRLDLAEPPPPGPHVRLSFPVAGVALAHSLQPDGGAGAAWDAEVTASPDLLTTPLDVALALDDLAALPAGYGRYVLDLDQGAALPLDGGVFGLTLDAAAPVRRLRVIVGTEAFAASVADGVPLQPVAFGLERSAPNPVRAQAAVTFSTPVQGAVSLDVVDLLGRRVAVLVDGERGAGRHTVRWSAAGLASGTYVLRLRAGGETATQTVTVVR